MTTAAAPPAMPSCGNGPMPKISSGDSGIENHRARGHHRRREEHVAGAADHRGERVEQPKRHSAGEHQRGIRHRRSERAIAAAHQRIKLRPKQQRRNCRQSAESDGDGDRRPNHLVGALGMARAQRAGDRRQDAAAHRAGRHHLQQHEQRKHQRHAGQRIEAELGDEIGLDQPDRRLHHHDDHVGQRQPQDGGADGRFKQHAGAWVHDTGLSQK